MSQTGVFQATTHWRLVVARQRRSSEDVMFATHRYQGTVRGNREPGLRRGLRMFDTCLTWLLTKVF